MDLVPLWNAVWSIGKQIHLKHQNEAEQLLVMKAYTVFFSPSRNHLANKIHNKTWETLNIQIKVTQKSCSSLLQWSKKKKKKQPSNTITIYFRVVLLPISFVLEHLPPKVEEQVDFLEYPGEGLAPLKSIGVLISVEPGFPPLAFPLCQLTYNGWWCECHFGSSGKAFIKKGFAAFSKDGNPLD